MDLGFRAKTFVPLIPLPLINNVIMHTYLTRRPIMLLEITILYGISANVHVEFGLF